MTKAIKFMLNKEETTSDPMVEVVYPTDEPPKPGFYEFQLTVTDDQGVSSTPAKLRLLLQGDAKAVLHLVNVDGAPIDQTTFKMGSQVFLSAKGSSSENGNIKAYVWKLTARP